MTTVHDKKSQLLELVNDLEMRAQKAYTARTLMVSSLLSHPLSPDYFSLFSVLVQHCNQRSVPDTVLTPWKKPTADNQNLVMDTVGIHPEGKP